MTNLPCRSNFGNTIPEPVGSCCCPLLETPSDLPARDAAWVYGLGAMVVVVTARSRGSVGSEGVEW